MLNKLTEDKQPLFTPLLTHMCAGLLESKGSGLGLLKSTWHTKKFHIQVVLVYLQPFWRNSLLKCVSQCKTAKKIH